jgi:hypothetical protein
MEDVETTQRSLRSVVLPDATHTPANVGTLAMQADYVLVSRGCISDRVHDDFSTSLDIITEHD